LGEQKGNDLACALNLKRGAVEPEGQADVSEYGYQSSGPEPYWMP
jgi:hypothetical protein